MAFVAQRVSLDHVGPFTFNGLRFLLGALSLYPLTFFLKPSGLSPREATWKASLRPGAMAGSVLFMGANLQQVGLQWTTAGKAAFLTGLYILLVPIAGLAFRRRPSWTVWWGAALGLVGLYLLSVTDSMTIGLGDSLELVGALFWTGHILLIDRFSPKTDPIKLSVVQILVCALLSLAIGLTTETFSWSGVGQATVPLLYAGIGSVGVAYTLQVVGQRGVAPGPAALIMSLETVFAVIGGALLIGETLGPRELSGCAFMLAGMALAQARPRGARQRGQEGASSSDFH